MGAQGDDFPYPRGTTAVQQGLRPVTLNRILLGPVSSMFEMSVSIP